MAVRIDPEESETRVLLEYIGPLTGKRVLEIGAGNGRVTWRYAGEAGHVTALDPDEGRIATAKQECPASLRDRVSFAPVCLEDFDPFPGLSRFDAAILSWSL